MTDNPLLELQGLVAFDRIKPEHVTPAIDQLLRTAHATVQELEVSNVPVSWDAFVEPLESATERLSRAWKAIEHLNAVADSPDLRRAYSENLPRITEFWSHLAQKRPSIHQVQGLACLVAVRRVERITKTFHRACPA